jgi:hypothetical protein
MDTPFDGINEKMERADQHIEKVRLEIAKFLDHPACPKGLMFDDGSKKSKRIIRAHRQRVVPMSLRVLTGEAIHQTRSVLDHAMWVLVEQNGGTSQRTTQFPIFEKKPEPAAEPAEPCQTCGHVRPAKGESERRRWQRQTAGLDPEGLAFIEAFQPYKRQESKNHPLWLLKTLNDEDKHKTVVMAASETIDVRHVHLAENFIGESVGDGAEGDAMLDAIGVPYTKLLSPTVVFRALGDKPVTRVTDVLTGLHGYVGTVLFRMKKQFFPELVGDLPDEPIRVDWFGEPPISASLNIRIDASAPGGLPSILDQLLDKPKGDE